mmetsp:Transcript_16426/g.55828  ORF Transcript_16426/g.55828 Transcript_16426/m.55828 type:complete len:227 (+) Transcript_16426:202-882(+)
MRAQAQDSVAGHGSKGKRWMDRGRHVHTSVRCCRCCGGGGGGRHRLCRRRRPCRRCCCRSSCRRLWDPAAPRLARLQFASAAALAPGRGAPPGRCHKRRDPPPKPRHAAVFSSPSAPMLATSFFILAAAMRAPAAALNFLLALNLRISVSVPARSRPASSSGLAMIHGCLKASSAVSRSSGFTLSILRMRSLAPSLTAPQYSSWNSYLPFLILENIWRWFSSWNGG